MERRNIIESINFLEDILFTEQEETFLKNDEFLPRKIF